MTRGDLEALGNWLSEQMPNEVQADESLDEIGRRLTQWLSKGGARRVELELELLTE
jgi:hypothetical protein